MSDTATLSKPKAPARAAAPQFRYVNVEGIKADIESRPAVYEQADRVNFSGDPAAEEYVDGKANPEFGYGRRVKVAAEFFAKLEAMIRREVDREFEKTVNHAGYYVTKEKRDPEQVELIMPVRG